MKKIKVIAIIIAIFLILVLCMDLRVQRLERSVYCDETRISLNGSLYIPEYCIKSGK